MLIDKDRPCSWAHSFEFVDKHSEARHRFSIKFIDKDGQEVMLTDWICDECRASFRRPCKD